MTAQTRPDELIRILRAEFTTKSGGVPGGGAGTCVAFTCGAIGWRGTAGTGVNERTLVHENAFQLTADGNARGDYAVDFQRLHGGADDVAGSYGSCIYSNELNSIGGTGGSDDDCEWSTIVGGYNDISDNASYVNIIE